MGLEDKQNLHCGSSEKGKMIARKLQVFKFLPDVMKYN